MSLYSKENITFIAAAALLLSGCRTQSHAERIDVLVKQSQTQALKHDLVGAEKSLQEAVRQADPGNLGTAKLLTKLADIEIDKQDFAAAEISLKKALTLYQGKLTQTIYRGDAAEEEVETLGKLGYVLKSQNKLCDAESAYKSAWQKGRQIVGSLKSHQNLDKQYLAILKEEGKSQEAENIEIAIAVEEPEDNDKALFLKGHDLVTAGKMSEAKKQFKIVRQLAKQKGHRKDWQDATILCALVDYCSGSKTALDKAAQEIYQGIKSNETASDNQVKATVATLAALNAEDGKPEEAKTLFAGAYRFDKEQELNVVRETAVISKGMAVSTEPQIRTGAADERAKAKKELERLIGIAKRNYLRAIALRTKPLSDSEMIQYRDDVGTLAWVYAANGESAPASDYYRQFFSMPGPTTRAQHTHFITLLIDAGKTAEAKSEVLKVIAHEQKKEEAADAQQLNYMLQLSIQAKNLKCPVESKVMAQIIQDSPYFNELPLKAQKATESLLHAI